MNADTVLKNLAVSMGNRIADLEVQNALLRTENAALKAERQSDADATAEA